MSYSKGQGWDIALSLYFELTVPLKHMDWLGEQLSRLGVIQV